MLKKKTVICLLLICAMVICWVQPAAAADAAFYYGDNAVADLFGKNVNIYNILNSGSEGFLVTCYNTVGISSYFGFSLCDTSYGTMVQVGKITSLSPYTSLDIPFPGLVSGLTVTVQQEKYRSQDFFTNYASALNYYQATGSSCYFLNPDSYLSFTDISVAFSPGVIHNMGQISSKGEVSYFTFNAFGSTGSNGKQYGLYSYENASLDGVWQANDAISGSSSVSQELNFTVKFSGADVSYTGIHFQTSGSTNVVSYSLASGSETVYVNGWLGDTRKTIDFGSEPQNVSSDFYAWFISNFTRTGDSEIYDDETSNVKIYDYGSGSLIQSLSLPIPHIIYATTAGIQIEEYGTAETLYSYTWSGSDAFAGFSLLSRDYVDYEVGTNFVNMSDSVTLYLYGEDDLSGGDDNPGGSGSTDNTDPTEPGDSPSTEPTVDLLDKEKDEINGSGNSALDDLTQAVPDYSQDFIAALGDLVRAFSYEGTNCELVIPALVLPGVDGLIPETELLPVTTVDFAEAFLIFPEKVVIVVRSLLTAALIVYCFKELYDTISYFLTLKRGDSNG